MTPARQLANRTAARIVCDALNAHGAKLASYEQIEREMASALEAAYGRMAGAVWLIHEPLTTDREA